MLRFRSRTQTCCTDHSLTALYKIRLVDSWRMQQLIALTLSANKDKPWPSYFKDHSAAIKELLFGGAVS